MSKVIEATMGQHGPETPEVSADFASLIDAIVDRYGANKQFSLAILQDTQRAYRYLPREALEHIAKRLGISLGEVYRLATFFAAFSLQPKGDYIIKVCLGTACHVQGGPRILDQLERDLSIKAGQTTPDGKFSVEAVRCLGACALAPVMLVNEDVHGKMSGASASKVVEKLNKGPALSEVEGKVEGDGAKEEEE
jgi:NADH:ubiquinone oxidoreductase subunit E